METKPSRATVWRRMQAGWTKEAALSTPARDKRPPASSEEELRQRKREITLASYHNRKTSLEYTSEENKKKRRGYKSKYFNKKKLDPEWMVRWRELKKKKDRKYNSNNKDKLAERKREYYLENKEEVLKRVSDYRDQNKELLRQKRRERYLAHRREYLDKILQYQKLHPEKRGSRQKRYYTKMRKESLDFTIKQVLSSRLRHALASQNVEKQKETLEFLGCSIEYFKSYLEKRFVRGMGWQNYGRWHIDHIRPCASFNLTNIEEQNTCFHYINLQPLWYYENVQKRHQIDWVRSANPLPPWEL